MSKFRFGFIPIFVAGLLTGIAGSLFGQSGIFDRIGIIPGHGSHGSLPEENIDLFTGNVTLRYRDVFLPGPNGFNLEVWRIYNSKILKDRQSGNPVVQAYHRSWVRIGWTMHMGMVHAYTSNSPIIEFPDGRLETAFPDKYHSGKYMTKDFLTYEKTTPPKLYFQDGVIWTFGATATLTRADGTNDPVRLVTKIENSFGHHIDITYVSGTPCMSSITDAMGRVVTFVSGGTPRRLVRIMTKDFENNDRILNYAVGTFSPSGYTRLDHFSPPVLPSTTFEYNSGAASDWELRKVNASYGGALEYTYANHDFFFNGIVLDSRVMIQKKITYEPGNEATWDYSYPDYDGVVSGTVSVDGPVFDTSVTYNAYDPGSPWEIGLISGLQYGDGSLSKSYGWTFQQVSDSAWWVLGTSMGAAKGPLVSTIDRHEEGSSAIKEEYLYENGVAKIYGLATKALNYVNGSELPTNYKTTDYYFLVYSDYETKHLLKLPYIEQEYTGEGVKQKERTTYYYHETGKYGAVLRMTVLKEGSTYCEWTYDYICHDSQGKSIQIHCSGPNDSFTSEQYSYGVKTSCTIGDTSIFHRVVSVYDSSIQYEISQDEATYYYDYDALGRVILRDWPNDRNDEITAWNLNNAETTQGGHKITRFWDGMGRDTGYIEAGEGEATLYYRKTLDAEGRLVAENIGSIDPNLKTEYTYNAAGNITETKDPLNRTTHITYSGTTKTVTDAENHPTTFEYGHLPGLPTRVTDAQGHASVNTYDPLGRLINVTFNGERTHGYEYDRADNLLAETHPETGRIEYSYDDENRLVEKHWGGTVTKYYHNSGGQVVLIEIGDGSDIDEKIFLLYWRGRLIEAHSTDKDHQVTNWERNPIEYDNYGNVTSETIMLPGLPSKTITYTYDRNNNPEKITYPDQSWAKIASNTLDLPETLSFNNDNNLLIGSASYGPRKAPTSLAFSRNGTQFMASYDNAGALDTVYLRRGGTDLYHADYEYNGAGNVTSIASAAPAEPMNASFGYDPLNRLISATYTTGRVGTFAYEYDPYGNMRSVQENGQPVFSKTYDGQNRIIGDGYDARGNVTSDGTYNYHWDKLNRLKYVTNGLSEVLGQYSYDERGLRFMAMPPLPEIEVFTNVGEKLDDIEDGDEVIFECPVGGPPVQKSFTIENEGLANLLLDGSPIITIQPNADEFSVVQQPVSPILPSGNTTFVIEFHPTSPGTKTAYISIANNDLSENPFDITLTGNLGPEMDILGIPDGGSWDFGEVQIRQSTESDFVIENTGRGDLLLTGFPKVQIDGDEFGQFSVRRQPDGVIHGGEFTYFVIRYSPVNEGPATAEVSIENNDLDENPYTFTISGTGLGGRAGLPDETDIDITEPDGDDLFVAGETRTIAWKGGKAAQFVRIECSTDNGSTYSTIAERVPNTGVFDWVVPPNYSPVCLIRISDADGILPAPILFSLDFDLKIGPEAGAGGENTPITIRAAVPDAESQTTYVADLAILYTGADATEALRLNLAESAPLELGSFAGEWRHIQLFLNMENYTGSVAVDGQPVLETVPLIQLPIVTDQPEVDISCQEGSSAKIWLENLQLRYQDRVQALGEDGGPLLRPLLRDAFDRYSAGIFPQCGGWLLNLIAPDGSLLPAGQAADKVLDQGGAQPGEAAEIDEAECLSPARSFRFEKLEPGTFTVVKRFEMPAHLPYALNSANFSIISQETKLLQIKERLDAAKKDAAGSSGTDTQGGVTPATDAPGGSSMGALTSVRAGTYYIYTFDGRLLAEYDISGICLKEYIYMGSRLVAEFNPSTSQYLYYTQDQIGSTRIVTDDTGTVVYAAAHDPYGGIQKVWVDAFDPKRKFSDKERDGETGLDYFGARYYSAPNSSEGLRRGSYRWLSIDPVLDRSKAIVNAQRWNLYPYCANNPLRYVDPDGRVLLCDRMYESILRIAGAAAARLSIVDGKLDVSKLTQEDLKDPGVKLLYDLAMSSYVFVYSEGPTISTLAGERPVGAENLICTYDIRFKGGQPPSFLPPSGVHGIVTINPYIQWVDSDTESRSVSLEAIAFHELAEVYAKIELKMQRTYPDGSGAHYHAKMMEEIFLSERPDFITEYPAGGNVSRRRFF